MVGRNERTLVCELERIRYLPHGETENRHKEEPRDTDVCSLLNRSERS